MDPIADRTPSFRRIGPTILVVLLAIVGIPAAAHLYIDLHWFRSIGHEVIFTTTLTTKLALGVIVGLVVAISVYLNLRLAARLSRGLQPLHLHDPEGVPRVNLREVAARLMIPATIGVGVLAGLINVRHWDTWLQFVHASSFGVDDPLFGRDISFYVFELPFYEATISVVLWTLGLSALASAGMYAACGGIAMAGRRTAFHRPARTHLSVLVALVFLVLSADAYLELARLLLSDTGPTTGASYADVHAKLPALKVKMATAAVAAVLVAASITRERLYMAVGGLALYLAVQLLGVELYPSMVHRFSVLPNEYEREKPYIKHNIDATRTAFGLESVIERDLSVAAKLTREDIDRNELTTKNIRLWDHEPLLDTFSQIQEIRTYYDFTSVDNDRYIVDGELRQTMLSPRELSAKSLPNRTWINERFTFTHGYGLTVGTVNEATPEGLPVLMVKDLPPISTQKSLDVTRPAIYYGELSSDHVFVKTRNEEFDYPKGEEAEYVTYDGEGGVGIGSTLRRAAVATRLGSLKLLLSDDITDESRVLLYRDIHTRVRQIASFLMFDRDPYMVIREDGTLVWIYDAYTVSSRYPYSEITRGFNYIRNSVKVVIDAYDGDVTLYAVDEEDPILKTWRKIFPDIFVSLSDMPADLRAHLRYPEDIFRVQTELFTIYHMVDPNLLYNREDQWEIPTHSTGERRQKMAPYYTIMKLPEEKEAEFILMLPFTPKRKDNLSAWMAARAEADPGRRLVVYRFPRDRLVYGPQQIINRINQDAVISRQISLWDQRGSEAIFGTLLVIPIEESLIYVRPLYLRSQGGRIPELKRVIVAYKNRIAMERTLPLAMEAIFGDGDHELEAAAAAVDVTADEQEPSETEVEPAPTDVQARAGNAPERALRHFERALSAQRAGDWARYGEELERVETYLRQMQPVQQPEQPAEPAAETP